MGKSLMIQGTMSNAGKSIITAGLCRVFMQDGYKVAPFKSQNMALNSFITRDGYEMGRAQVIQAEACCREPDVRMNPILLKPTNDIGSQVIVNGEVLGNMSARAYFDYKPQLVPQVKAAFDSLSAENDIVVIEGAGSPTEINLPDDCLVNMGMAKIAKAPVLLVGDIDRGGVFASLYGTVKLLPPEQQAYFKGLVINKFRGDPSILAPGYPMLEELCGVKVMGAVPYAKLDIEDEDSLSTRLEQTESVKVLDLAVIRLPRISNFTDFNALERFGCASVRYVNSVTQLGEPDCILLPGTKNTMGDLLWMRQNGLEAAILKKSADGTPVFGICGGYQMIGRELSDPHNLEHGGILRGMGLLETTTIFEPEKTRTRVSGTVGKIGGLYNSLSDATFAGYEIHMGQTVGTCGVFSKLDNGGHDGAWQNGACGSYVHGLFDEGNLAERFIGILLERKGLSFESAPKISFYDYKQREYDKLADVIRQNLDMKAVYKIIEKGI
ncbi:MAG: cobyric acid synthase [Eubacteriales bacterium]